MLGECADRDKVDTGLCNGYKRVVGHVARGFQFGAAGAVCNGVSQGFQTEIVEHDSICAGGQCQLQLGAGFYLYFNRLIGRDLSCGRNGFAHTARRRDVVLFDQKGIK